MRVVRPNPRNFNGKRSLSDIKVLVVHCTEGSSAAGAAGWWARPTVRPGSEGSAHVTFDDTEAIRSVDDDEIAYGAFGFNGNGLHIEHAGFARWTRAEWLQHMPMLTAAATWAGEAMRAYGIPFVESATHGYHGHAALPGNNHTDPGPGFPWDVWLAIASGGPTVATPDYYLEELPHNEGGIGPVVVWHGKGTTRLAVAQNRLMGRAVSTVRDKDGVGYVLWWAPGTYADGLPIFGPWSNEADRDSTLKERESATGRVIRPFSGRANSRYPVAA